jgi:WD40 repeat protein
MSLSMISRISVVLLVVAHFARAAESAGNEAPRLEVRAMTILRENCTSCHNAEKKKGKLLLTSRETALNGGENGAAVVPGDVAKSLMATVVAADADPHMPPKGQLTDDEIKTLKAWINAGAEWDQAALTAPKVAATTRPVELKALPADYRPVLAIALSPDQKRLAVGRGDRVLVYDVEKKERPQLGELASPNDVVQALAWGPDGKTLAVGGFRRIRIWDPTTGQVVRQIDGLSGRVTALAFTPDGATLVAGDGEVASSGMVRLWRMPGGEPVGNWVAHGDSVLSVHVSKDGKLLATAGADRLAKVWDLPTGKEVAKLEGHAGPVVAVAFNADGTELASAGMDKEIKVWDVKTREQVVALATNPSGVTALAWVDGKTLLSSSDDGVVRFSSKESKDRAIRTFPGAPDVLYCAAISADGKSIYAGCHDGQVYVWSVANGKLEGKLSETPSAEPGRRLNFANDVLPLLSRAGCNAGACHAKPAGQGGFKLSVFAYDPKADYRAIVKDDRGRRVFPAAIEESLVLRKPTLTVDHGGGLRLKRDSEAYRTLVKWIEQGMPYAGANDPVLASVEVSPKEGSYKRGATQALRVVAHYSDGSTRDVTHLADFASNEKELARVDENGVVRVGDVPGEGVIVARYMGLVDVSRVTVPADVVLPDSLYAQLPVNNFIDRLVYGRLKKLGIAPSGRCTDEEFIRRATLDAIGELPTPDEVRAFLSDSGLDKRARLIDRLLASSLYGDHWANKWGDLLRPNPFRAGVKSVYTLDQWLRESFRQNKPFDQFAREILTARGSTHRDGPVVVFRDRREPQDIAPFVSQVFLGVRLECAKCHHHPNEKWTQDDFYELAAYFGPLKRKGQGISAPISGEAEFIGFAPGRSAGEVRHPVTGEVMKPKPPDGPLEILDPKRDPREGLAAWVTRPDNPFFARATVNRVWGELLGRGIVHPVDDFRASNPPTNPALLDALARDFVDHGYDLKHLIGTIMRSNVYQLSSIPNEHNARDLRNFSRFYRRRPTAEVALDSVCELTGVPEALQGLAPGSRAVEVWNNRLDSDFLDAFGRPNASADPPCERQAESSVVQALHLMNSTRLMGKITNAGGRAAQLAKSQRSPEEIVTELYLAAYSRYPTAEELKIATGVFAAEKATRQSATEDVMWALINSAEFVFNH